MILFMGWSNFDGRTRLWKLIRNVEGWCLVSLNIIVTVLDVRTFSHLRWILTQHTKGWVLKIGMRNLFHHHKFRNLTLFLLFFFYRMDFWRILRLGAKLSLRVLFVCFSQNLVENTVLVFYKELMSELVDDGQISL
jgi:hypothetical protein